MPKYLYSDHTAPSSLYHRHHRLELSSVSHLVSLLRSQLDVASESRPFRRILVMLNYEDPTTGTYALAKAPTSAKFGQKGQAQYVCLYDTPIVVKYWVVGRIEYLYFREGAKSVSLTVTPLQGADMEAANALLRRYSNPAPRKSPALVVGDACSSSYIPAVSKSTYDSLRISAWQGTEGTADVSILLRTSTILADGWLWSVYGLRKLLRRDQDLQGRR